MWSDHSDYRLNRIKNHLAGVTPYNEPGIVLSFSELIPDIVGEFKGDDYTLSVIKPSNSSASFDLKEDGHFRLFGQIPELVEILPDIKRCVPVLHPQPEQAQVSYWPPDSDNQGRMWL